MALVFSSGAPLRPTPDGVVVEVRLPREKLLIGEGPPPGRRETGRGNANGSRRIFL
jgi:hypothetical protein